MKLFGGKPTEPSPSPDSSPEQFSEKKGIGRKLALPLLALVLLLAALGAGSILLTRLSRSVEAAADGAATPELRPPIPSARVISTPPPESEDVQGTAASITEGAPEEPVTEARDCKTFLLLGIEPAGTTTDTIIVGRWDRDASTLDAVSIPRDTLVNVPWELKKMNTILHFEQQVPDQVLGRFTALLGFCPDYYIVLNALTAEALVNNLGGVDYNLMRDMDYDDPSQDLHIHLSAGRQHLNGEETVDVLRFRVGNDGSGYPNGDLGRISTQQDLLGSLARQLISGGIIPNLDAGIRLIEDNCLTNLTETELRAFAEGFVKLDPDNIRFSTAPGQPVSIRGGFYYQLDPEAWTALVNAALNPKCEPLTEDGLDVLREFGDTGAISTTGEIVPMENFFDYYSYTG